jgi:ABC-type transport system substrate-binding protein
VFLLWSKLKNKKNLLLIIVLLVTICLSAIPIKAQDQEYFFTLHLHSSRDDEFTELFKAQLSQIGINLALEVVDGPEVWARLDEGGMTGKTFEEGGYDLSYFGAGIDTVDPAGLKSFFHSESQTPAGSNSMNFFHAKADSALENGATTLGWENREPYYLELAEILYDELPLLPLYWVEPIDIMRKDLIYCDPWASDGTGEPVKTTKWGEEPSIEPGDWYFWGLRFFAREGETYEDDTTLVVSRLMDVRMLNPVLAGFSSSNSEIHFVLYDSLIWNHNSFVIDREYRPDLAESWDVSEDGLTYTFHLRQDVKWHDGETFDADDVICTFEAYLDPDTAAYGSSYVIDAVKSITAIDPYTVEFKLKWKDPAVFEHVFESYIIPEHIWGNIPHSEWMTSDYNTGVETPIGTGPYKFVEWVKDSHIQMDRYEDYHLCPIFFDHYFYKIYPDRATAVMAVQAGECDIHSAQWQDQEVAEENPDIMKVSYGRSFYSMIIMYNIEHPILNNKYVRKAINAAMPREHMVENLNHGLGAPANQFIVPGDPGHNSELAPYEYDISLAKEYMEKAGYDYDNLIPEEQETPTQTNWYVPALGGVIIGLIIGALATYYFKK